MVTAGQALIVFLLAACVGLTWYLPRHYGLHGILGAHALTGAGFFAMAFVAFATGVLEYDGGIEFFVSVLLV